MSRLVVASNRVLADAAQPAPGGLAVALRGALAATGGMWFGWSGRVAGRATATARVAGEGALRTATVDLSRADHARFYRGYCNEVLWPLCHGLACDAVAGTTDFAAYLRVNRRYAAALVPLLRAGDRIWVHDFHLIPLGGMLRRAGCRQPLGFFLHVPFPEPERMAALPQAARLLRALRSYDLLGFQTARDLEAFHAAVEQLGSQRGRRIGATSRGSPLPSLATIPVGIDVDAVRREAMASSRTAFGTSDPLLQTPAGDRALVVGVDRLDPAKGICERLRAYERLLGMPDVDPRRLSLLQVLSPPRGIAEDAAALRGEVEALTARINARHGAAQAGPLQLLQAPLPHSTVLALLARARVGVVSALRDGMNLVAKEYVAAQDPADPGVLVLSVHAGAARELTAALQVEPRDPGALAAAIHRALRMPVDERRRRHASMLEVLRRNDLHAWTSRFLERLEGASSGPARPALPPGAALSPP